MTDELYQQARQRLDQAGFSDEYQAAWSVDDGGLVLAIAVPRTSRQRRRGLLGREFLSNGVGLLLPAPLIHSIGMKMNFDALWLSRGRIVSCKEGIRPGRPLIFGRSWSCLELAEGETERLALHPGSSLTVDCLAG